MKKSRQYSESTKIFSLEKIDTLLSKHFLQETSAEEEDVAAFRENNKREYELLQKFWKRKNIEVMDFNSAQALERIREKRVRKSDKIISIYKYYRRIAAAIVILLMSSFATYYILNRGGQPHQFIVQTGVNERFNKITLSDGSVAWLNKNTTLTYPEKFLHKERKVILEGEAFFEITKSKKQTFVVSTRHSDVTVLGTSFNVKASGVETEVTVKTGKVEVTSDFISEKVILFPDQTAIVSENQMVSHKVRNVNYLSWKTGVFEFDNTPLNQVISDLNSYYRDQIAFETELDCTCNLTARFDQESIDEIVMILETTCDLVIQKENNQYIIK
ncbi:MAG: FecR domain-containing protein [Bacteroidales bacterium]|nr:FecR domain-containing protein [Bacteroidales bacterium]